MGRRVRYDDKVQVTYGMDILEQLALIVGLLGQVFMIYLFFDMFEYTWWLGLVLSVSITTAIYYTIKYMVDWLHQV